MNVLFLAHSYPRFATDPVGSFVLRLAMALREQDVHVEVVAPAAPGLPSRELLAGIPVRRYRYARSRHEDLAYTGAMRERVRGSWSGRIAFGGLLAAGAIAAARARRRLHAELVHAHWWLPGGVVGGLVGGLARVPLVTTLHGSDLRIARSSPGARRLFARVARRSAALTTVSRWLAEEARALVPGLEPIVAPMPVAVDGFPQRTGAPRDRLLYVGKLNEQKGIVPLLRALARMRRRATLDVVVGVGDDEVDARALASELGLEDRVRWHPLLEQAALAARYREATALVVPAIDEGLGMTAIEALLSGTPVVAFASGGLTDSVVHEETGLLVPPGDVGALAGALDDLLERDDQGASLGVAGRRRALDLFSPAAAARRYADLYRTVRAPRNA